MNELINYEGVCRTAPATPGLSNIGFQRAQGEAVLPRVKYNWFEKIKVQYSLGGGKGVMVK